MKLESVELQGFRSYAAPQVLDIAAMEPGLYHVAGENKVEPSLEGNAAGKTTLFEAPFWAAFGKTSKGLKAGDLKHWTAKQQMAVITQWQTPAGSLGLFRTWKPNNLEVTVGGGEPRPVDQAELEGLLGMTQEAFLASVYFAQSNIAFVDLSAAEQTALFTSVLGLGLWEQAADDASTAARTAADGVQTAEQALARLDGQLTELEKQAKDYAVEEAEWAKEVKAQIKDAKEDLASKQALLKQCEGFLAEAKKGAGQYRKKMEAVAAVAGDARALGEDFDRIERELSALRRDDISTCPTCGGPIDSKHIRKELEKKGKERNAAHERVSNALMKHDNLLKEAAPFKEQAERETTMSRAVAAGEQDVMHSAAFLEQLQRAGNPYTKKIKETDERGEELMAEWDAAEKALTDENSALAAAQFWTKGFKEIRLREIERSLSQLTIECNEVLFQLGLEDWEIAFDIEKPNKGGSITKSFSTFVRSPHTDKAVPWEAWSGGESQRLRLAITMGFSNLICSRAGIAPNFEFWDEPTQWMPARGIHNLLTVLAERAQRYSKVILLADHRSFDFGGFAGRIDIIKDKDGSQIFV